MPARKMVPDKNTFERYLKAGLTQREMVEEIERTTGEVVTRSAVAQALSRYGLAEQAERYTKQIPWRVREEHINEYPARMLRLLGRRMAGKPLTDRENQRLDNWLAKLKQQQAVVGYDPTHPRGFAYIPRRLGDPRDIPIHRQTVKLPA